MGHPVMVNGSLFGFRFAATVGCLDPVEVDGFMQEEICAGGQGNEVVSCSGVAGNRYRTRNRIEAEGKCRSYRWVFNQNRGARNQVVTIDFKWRHCRRSWIVVGMIANIVRDLNVSDTKAIQR